MSGHAGAPGPSELAQHLLAQAASQAETEAFFWHRLRSRYALRAIGKLCPGDPVVLDVGAGAGVFHSHYKRAFPAGDYAFVEPIEDLAARLRSIAGPGSDWGGRPDYSAARAAVLLDVLEHQEDDAGFLRALAGKLAPGAVLVLSCPALPSLWSSWDERLGHYRRYRLGPLRRVIESAGFELIDSRYLFQAMVLPGMVRRHQKAGNAEFPRLPRPVNELVYGLGRIEQALCGWMPFGSSVAAVCRKR